MLKTRISLLKTIQFLKGLRKASQNKAAKAKVPAVRKIYLGAIKQYDVKLT